MSILDCIYNLVGKLLKINRNSLNVNTSPLHVNGHIIIPLNMRKNIMLRFYFYCVIYIHTILLFTAEADVLRAVLNQVTEQLQK